MTDAPRPAPARPPSNEWFPASDDQDRAHLVSCRRYITACSPVQQECRLTYRLVSNIRDGEVYRPAAMFAHSPEFVAHARKLVLTPGPGSITGRTALEGQVVHIADLAS